MPMFVHVCWVLRAERCWCTAHMRKRIRATSEAGELSQSSFFNASLSSRTKIAPSAAISSPSGVGQCVSALQHKLCDNDNNFV